jgi:hypothetical protein
MIPIDKLPKLERKILRHHILTFPHESTGLPLLGLFPAKPIHPNNREAAISNLVKEEYYIRPDVHAVRFTPLGYYECYKYFKVQFKCKHTVKSVCNSLKEPGVSILVGVVTGVFTGVLTAVLLYIISNFYGITVQQQPQQPLQPQPPLQQKLKSIESSPGLVDFPSSKESNWDPKVIPPSNKK